MLIKMAGQSTKRDLITAATATAAANTSVAITIAAVANRKHWVHNVQWSYSENPIGGRLTVTSAGVTKFDVDITTGGPGGFSLEIVGGTNEQVVVTLAAGSGTCVGKLNIQYTTETFAYERNR